MNFNFINLLSVNLGQNYSFKYNDNGPLSARFWAVFILLTFGAALGVAFWGEEILGYIIESFAFFDKKVYWCVLFTLVLVLVVYGIHNHSRFRMLEVSALWRPRSEFESKYVEILEKSEKTFIGVGITLASLHSDSFLAMLKKKIEADEGFSCDLVLVNPASIFLAEREREEEHSPGRLAGDIHKRLKAIFDIKESLPAGKKDKIRVHLINNIPSMFIVQTDKEIIFSPYLHRAGKQSFAFLVRTAPKGKALFNTIQHYAANLIKTGTKKDVYEAPAESPL